MGCDKKIFIFCFFFSFALYHSWSSVSRRNVVSRYSFLSFHLNWSVTYRIYSYKCGKRNGIVAIEPITIVFAVEYYITEPDIFITSARNRMCVIRRDSRWLEFRVLGKGHDQFHHSIRSASRIPRFPEVSEVPPPTLLYADYSVNLIKKTLIDLWVLHVMGIWIFLSQMYIFFAS